MGDDGKGDYEVGRGKPPRDTRFKKGQSGNPKGRPPGSRNMYTLLHRALNEKVVIVVNGQRKRITKIEAACWQLANGAASGKLRHVQFVMHIFPLMEERAQKMTPPEAPKLPPLMSREARAREVLRILIDSGEIRASDLFDDATRGNSEPACQAGPALPPPDSSS